MIEDTPDRLVVHARYFYRDRFQQGGAGEGGQICAGFDERTFTLARDQDGRPVVVEMTGQQDEPAIRSLIRRALPLIVPGRRQAVSATGILLAPAPPILPVRRPPARRFG